MNDVAKNRIGVIAILTSLILAPDAWSKEQELVGFWESVDASRGGIGSTLEFTADGDFSQSAAVLVESKYRFEGSSLIMIDESGHEQILPVVVGSGTMELSGPNGAVVRKTRIRDPSGGTSPVLGDWTYPYVDEAKAYERFTEDGRMFFRLMLRNTPGSYEIKGKKVRLNVKGRKAQTWRYERNDSELLIGPKGEMQRYRLVEGGRWYSGADP